VDAHKTCGEKTEEERPMAEGKKVKKRLKKCKEGVSSISGIINAL
jgi:hypothetical protein